MLRRISLFTLTELVMSMAILSLLITVSFTLFSSYQNTWAITNARQEVFENARIAIDLMTRDLESAIYKTEDSSAPFWHHAKMSPGANWNEFSNELLAFVTYSPIPPNNNCTSNKYELKYQLYYAANHNDEHEGWLRRSITGNITDEDETDTRWNWQNNLTVGYTTEAVPTASLTANSTSSQDYRNLIPNVLDVSFVCDTDSDANSVLPPDQTTSKANNACSASQFPTTVTINLTLLDKSSWDKWISLCGSTVYHAPEYTGEPEIARDFREAKQLTFTRTVLLGDRGQ
ncbi:MAG TPA: hypothetical protein DD381_10950 [Lentisphaeria bacterium]|nr:MAG: hypothetical protein A2X47_00650 [Lentisphaerae bacterium GWF2_38_69]HBM16845.1 hypothetical protein [Lentisphaeria bacterium]